MEPVRLGAVPDGLGTPDRYLTVEDDDGPRLRVDIYSSVDECHAYEELQIWSGCVILGRGHHLYIVGPREPRTTVIDLGSYFGHIYPGDGFLLVASAERLMRVRPDATVLWASGPLGIDGVIVDEVTGGIIKGRGEWDPPGGWRPFRLSLESGEMA